MEYKLTVTIKHYALETLRYYEIKSESIKKDRHLFIFHFLASNISLLHSGRVNGL